MHFRKILTSFVAAALVTTGVLGILPIRSVSHYEVAHAAYGFSRTITIDHTKVGTTTDSTNFPVLISGTYSYLATVANGGKVQSTTTQTGGGASITVPADLKFTSDSAGTTRLNWEFETYSTTTGAVNVWVNVPTVSHTVDTVIYLFYGDASVTTWQGNVTSTWNSNYKGVWHFPDGSTVSLKDSTVTGVTGTNVLGVSAGTGQIDGAASFVAAAAQYVDTGTSTPYNSNTITLSAWVKTNLSGSYAGILDRDDFGSGRSFQFRMNPAGKLDFIPFIGGTPITTNVGATSINDNVLRLVTATYDGSNIKLYINGVQDFTAAQSGNMDSKNVNMAIGHIVGGGSYWDGIIDEARLSNTARSADWISAEYNNQSSPATFYTFGSETAAGASSPTRRIRGHGITR